jgi:hypothetical protein
VEADVADHRPVAAPTRDDRARQPLEARRIPRHLVEPEPQEAAVVLVRPAGGNVERGVAREERAEELRREEDELEPPRPDRR